MKPAESGAANFGGNLEFNVSHAVVTPRLGRLKSFESWRILILKGRIVGD